VVDLTRQQVKEKKMKILPRAFPIASRPLRVLAAPDLICDDLATNLMDWAPQSDPFAENSKLAVALQDSVFIQDVLNKGQPF